MAVELTEQEKQSPLYKYFERDIAIPVEELALMVKDSRMDPADALLPDHINDLFEDGYLPGEFGYCLFEDGSAMLANRKEMPEVTPEMIDWWFGWHTLEPMRYKIWDKNNHIFCITKNADRVCDESLSLKERYWNTDCEIIESHIPGETPGHVIIPFRNPADIGFSPEKLKDFKGTIVCSGDEKSPVVMAHFFRPLEKGVELRTRFWYGYHVVNGKIERMQLPPHVKFNDERMQHTLMHNINEFSNLSIFLPELYAEFKDKPWI